MKAKIIYNHLQKAIKIVFLFIIACSFSSCIESLLDTSPYNEVASSNMWSTEALTNAGLAGIYEPLRDGYSDGTRTQRTLWELDQLGLCTMPRDVPSYKSGSITSGDGLFNNVWKAQYTGIMRANDLIHNMPGISPIPEPLKARYVAEAKFLRAYYYFRLNQVFKGVPVYLEEVLLDEMIHPRETEQKVWEVILQDLTDAINETNLPDKYAPGKEDYGHVTKGAAYALRGKVYLYMKEYTKAISDFEQVEKIGHSLFKGNYRDLFREENEQCDEMIFSIQFVEMKNYGTGIQLHYGSRSAVGGNWNNYLVSNEIVDLYEHADGTPFDWEDYLPGYYSLEPEDREVFFLRDTLGLDEAYPGISAVEKANIGAKVKERLTALGADIAKYYLPQGNEERVRKAYENRDPRLAANVITPYSTFSGWMSSAENIVTSRWPYSGHENSPVRDLRTDTQANFFYLHRKFVYEAYEIADGSRSFGPIDFPIIRYTDVLLMKAEALAESNAGVSTEAITLVNQVRERAKVALLNTSPATTVKDREDLINRIRNERRYEFVNEGINYFDELRWGTLKEMVFFEGNGRKNIWGNVLNKYVWKGDDLYDWAIPLSEIQRNPNLKQNGTWGN